MKQDAWQPGQLIGGRYRLERPLAQGGMGTVWIAEHLALSSHVAVKIIDRVGAESEELRARFVREAQSAASLRSPHVVQILDYGLHEDDVPFIVMELLEGETLAHCLQKNGGSLRPARVARIMAHVARAVGKAHEKDIVHRDLKPDNIFLVQNEDEEIAKVLDFGIAKVRGPVMGGLSSSNTRTGTLLGTPFYMSPEQARGNSAVDLRTDLWSMAIITYEAVCGQLPFQSDGLGDLVIQICTDPIPVPSKVAQVPAGFDEWFAKAASRDPKGRFASAREQSDALRQVLAPDHVARASLAEIDEVLEAPTRLYTKMEAAPPARISAPVVVPERRLHLESAATLDAPALVPPAAPSGGIPKFGPPPSTAVTVMQSTGTLASGKASVEDEPPSTEPETVPRPLGSTTRGAVSVPRPSAPQTASSKLPVFAGAAVLVVAAGVYFTLSRIAPPQATPASPAPSAEPAAAPTAATPSPPETSAAVPPAASATPPPVASASPPPPAAGSVGRAPGALPAKRPAPKAKGKDDLGI